MDMLETNILGSQSLLGFLLNDIIFDFISS